MTRFAFSLLTVVAFGNFASAQSPAIGQLTLPGNLHGYSPLVPSIDPFPSRSSGYYHSMFHPQYGGKRVSQIPTRLPNAPVVVQPGAVVQQAEALPLVGPVAPAQAVAPLRGFRRFGR